MLFSSLTFLLIFLPLLLGLYFLFKNIKIKNIILLIFSITSQDSFDSIAEWMKNIREVKSKEFPVVLLGNKIDLEESRVISKLEGEELAKKYELPFYETSNKSGENIESQRVEQRACNAAADVNVEQLAAREILKENPPEPEQPEQIEQNMQKSLM